MNLTDKIKKARRTLESKKQLKAEQTGKRKALMDELWTNHKIRTVKGAEARIDELERDMEDKQRKLDVDIKKLDDMMTEMEGKKDD